MTCAPARRRAAQLAERVAAAQAAQAQADADRARLLAEWRANNEARDAARVASDKETAEYRAKKLGAIGEIKEYHDKKLAQVSTSATNEKARLELDTRRDSRETAADERDKVATAASVFSTLQANYTAAAAALEARPSDPVLLMAKELAQKKFIEAMTRAA